VLINSIEAIITVAILIMSILTAVPTGVVVEGQQQEGSSPINNGVPILSSSVIRTDFGYTYVIGEVRNDLSAVVESVQILARFYDSNGRLIDTGSASTELSQLRPGEKSPFKLSITDASLAQRIANYNLTVDWDMVSGSGKPAALRIQEGEQRLNETDEHYEIVGEVINEGSDETTSIKVITTLYDETGRVIGTDYTYAEPSELPTDQSAIFEISGSAGNRSADVESVKLTTQSNDYLMIDLELDQGLQQIQLQQEGNATIFQSIEDGFRIQVPGGWAVQDVNNSDIDFQTREEQAGRAVLAILCPQAASQPVMGGSHECDTTTPSTTSVMVMRFKDLDHREEFASTRNQSITISDFLAFYPKFLESRAALEGAPVGNIQIMNTTDTTVNVTSALTNHTIETLPAKLIEYTLTYGGIFTIGAISLLVLDETAITGYSTLYLVPPFSMEREQPPRPVQQIFDSFELLDPTSNGSTSSSSSLTAPSSSFPDQQQQQQQSLLASDRNEIANTNGTVNQTGGATRIASGDDAAGAGPTLTILEGSAIVGRPDYDPDELTVPEGSEVTVVNQDTLPHTVTSGTGPTDPNSAQFFDTSLIIGGESSTLSLAQVTAGQYDFYCMVHPYMTGKLAIVAAG
jgi:plastocyanin